MSAILQDQIAIEQTIIVRPLRYAAIIRRTWRLFGIGRIWSVPGVRQCKGRILPLEGPGIGDIPTYSQLGAEITRELITEIQISEYPVQLLLVPIVDQAEIRILRIRREIVVDVEEFVINVAKLLDGIILRYLQQALIYTTAGRRARTGIRHLQGLTYIVERCIKGKIPIVAIRAERKSIALLCIRMVGNDPITAH